MNITGSACSLMLLTMVAVCSSRNATEYFLQGRFQHPPSRPEDALVFLIGNVPPLVCEPEKGECVGSYRSEDYFCFALPRGYSFYKCWFEGNATMRDNLQLIEDSFPHLFAVINRGLSVFTEKNMYCTTDSQLPDEYFHLRIERPHEDRPVKCRILSDDGTLFLRFPGYPTVVCQTRDEAGRYFMKLPCIDEQLKCSFRVYSELPLGNTHTEERLYRSLTGELPSGRYGLCPRLVCSRSAATNGTSRFQLQLQGGATYACSFPDAVNRLRGTY